MYKIAIIGTGYVGLTTGIGLASFGSQVLCLDIDAAKIDQLNAGILPIYEPGMLQLFQENVVHGRLQFSTDLESGVNWANIIFIAVGTPQGEDGQANLSTLFEVVKNIRDNITEYKIIVTKSTVPIGTNEKVKQLLAEEVPLDMVDVISNPEFLREGKAIYDFTHPDRVVIGSDNERPLEAMKRIYRPLYLNEVPFIFTDLRTAELIKYASNCFLATKVAFINEMSRMCDAVGANVQTVAQAMGKDGRIGNKFLHPSPGFGGSCFPKDTSALAAMSKLVGMDLPIVEATINSNIRQKEYMFEKIQKEYTDLRGKKIAVLGLAFKSDTDDMRDSASIVVINDLLQSGAHIKAYDPQAMDNAKKIWADAIVYGKGEYEILSGADGLVILTEWNQFRNLDLEKISRLMAQKKFFDFRNIYKRNEIESQGFKYIGVGT